MSHYVPRSSTLLCQQMKLCGHRGTYGGSGYPYFNRSYRSGGLRALIERLEDFCAAATTRQQTYLQDDSDLELIRPVSF